LEVVVINTDTVFILGAGSGVPYGFPTGDELTRLIVNKGLAKYRNQVQYRSNNYREEHLRLANRFRDHFHYSRNSSIDLFLSRSPDYSDIGRKVIILSLLHKEMESKKIFNDSTKAIENDWLRKLINNMLDGLSGPKDYTYFHENKVSFVTFNYDRSLELYLYLALKHTFNEAREEEIKEQLSMIPVYHVYGKIAPLPWENDGLSIEYGYDNNIQDMDNISENIRIIRYLKRGHVPTLDEMLIDIEDIQDIREKIKSCHRIYFLGFGFAPENMLILNIPEIINKKQKVYGTTFKLIKEEQGNIAEKFNVPHLTSWKPTLEDTDCLTLLRKYFN